MDTPAIAPIPNMAPKQESLKDKLLRYILGEDIFISYSRQDGTNYALALARKLSEQNYSCKFDQWGTPPGKELPDELQQSLRRSTVLVLVCTELAAQSESVGKEINIFLKTGRYIIPIDVDGSLSTSVWKNQIFGIPESQFTKNVIVESEHGATEPSEDVLRRISDTFTYKRKNERLRKAAVISALAIGLFFFVALAGAGVAGYQIDRAAEARNQANQATALAEQAKLEASAAAAEAKRQTDLARTESQRAEQQTRIANEAIEQSNLARAEADKQTAIASQKRKEAAAEAEKARQLNYASDMQLASRLYGSGDVDEFYGLLGGADDSLRGFEWHYLEDLPKGAVNFALGDRNVSAVLFSRDGKLLITGAATGPLQLWDPQTGKPVKTLREDEAVTDLAGSPDGKWLASCGGSDVSLWNATSWTEQVLKSSEGAAREFDPFEEFRFVSFTADNLELLTVSEKRKELLFRRWSTETGRQIGTEQSISKKFPGRNTVVKKFASDGQIIVKCDAGTFLVGSNLSRSKFDIKADVGDFRYAFLPDGRFASVEVVENEPQHIELRERDLTSNSARAFEDSKPATEWQDITVSSDGSVLAALRHGEVKIWNIWTLKPIKAISVKSIAKSIALSPDGSKIAVGGYDDELETDSFLGIWKTRSPDSAFTFGGDFLSASLDGTKVLTRNLRLWNAVSGTSQNLGPIPQLMRVEKAALSPDASRAWAFISVPSDENGSTSLRVWNLSDGSELYLKSKTECKHAPTTDFSLDSKRLIGFCADESIRVWSMDDGNELIKLEGENAAGDVKKLVLTPNKLIVFYSHTPSRYWELKTGARQSLEVCSEVVTDVSPNGEWWLTKGKDDNYYLRKADTKKCEKDPLAEKDHNPMIGAEFSRDSKFVAVFYCLLPTGTGDCEKTLLIQKLARDSHAEIVSKAFDNFLGDIQISPSGRWIRFGSKVWDQRTKNTFSIVGCASSSTFAEDQNRLITTCADGTLKFWSLTSGQELFALKAHNSKIDEAILLPKGRHLLTTSGYEAKLWRGDFH